VINKQVRSLDCVSGRRVSGEGPAADSAEEISRLWIADARFRNINRNGSVWQIIAGRIGIGEFGLGDDEDSRDAGIAERAILKRDVCVRIARHTHIELLSGRCGGIPHDPPAAVRNNVQEVVNLHLEHEHSRFVGGLADGNIIDQQLRRGERSGVRLGMRGLVSVNDDSVLVVSNVRRRYFIIRARFTIIVDGGHGIIVCRG
jgi:hypothetical protein